MYCELPTSNRRNIRCWTSHHSDFQVVPRANRTFSPARNPIPCASSSKGEAPVFAPWPPWRFSVRAAWSGGHTYSALPEGYAHALAPLPPAGSVIESSLVSSYVPAVVDSHSSPPTVPVPDNSRSASHTGTDPLSR